MINMKHLLLLIAIICLFKHLEAQTPQFTQFYHTPLVINPAFAGTSEQYRFGLVHRQQWLGAALRIATTYAAFDANLPAFNSGIGTYLIHDVAADGILRQTYLQAAYSFYLRLGNTTAMQLGLNAGVGNRIASLEGLLFTSQVHPNEPDVFEGIGGSHRLFADFGTGFLFYSKTLWISIAALHLNRPDIALLAGETARLPILYAFHTGGRFSLSTAGSGKVFVMPTLFFKYQGVALQADVGIRLAFELFPLQGGLQYRGIPLKKSFGLWQQDALAAIIGLQGERWQVAYSYDLPLSSINQVSSGTHEIGIVYQWATRAFRRYHYVNCPAF